MIRSGQVRSEQAVVAHACHGHRFAMIKNKLMYQRLCIKMILSVGTVYVKEPLLLIGKSSSLNGSRFSLIILSSP